MIHIFEENFSYIELIFLDYQPVNMADGLFLFQLSHSDSQEVTQDDYIETVLAPFAVFLRKYMRHKLGFNLSEELVNKFPKGISKLYLFKNSLLLDYVL